MPNMTTATALPLLTDAAARRAGTIDLVAVPFANGSLVDFYLDGEGDDHTYTFTAQFITETGDRYEASITEWWFVGSETVPETSKAFARRVAIEDRDLAQLVESLPTPVPATKRSWLDRMLNR